jgi:phosphoserine phosphatase RsbU/P
MSSRKVLALLTCNASLRDDYQGALRLGMERACAERDIDLWVFAGRNNWTGSADQHRLFRLLDSSRVDGIVLAAGLIESFTPLDGVLDTLARGCAVPMCAVGQKVDGTPSLLIDNARAAAQTAEHLVTVHGCRRFAYLSGPREHHESQERLRGVANALARHGLSLESALVRHGDFAVSGGRRACAELLASGAQFDALLAVNDHMALGAIEALRGRERAAPNFVAVAGFDDAASARFGVVPLTTIRQPVRRLGELAVATIARLWRGETVPAVTTLETELILRESCGCHPAGLMLSSPPNSDAGSDRDELRQALCPVLDDAARRLHWSSALPAAVAAERQGDGGALEAAFVRLIEELGGSHVPLHELQRVISILWRRSGSHTDLATEGAFHATRIKIGALMYQRAGEQNLRDDQLVDELRLSCERLATSLEQPALERAILAELPRLGIHNGLIAIYTDETAERLRPLLLLRDGAPWPLPLAEYAARLLLPDAALGHERRISLTVLPLTFESEQLGVAALELPLGSEAYALLREQIGSCIKAAQIHAAMRAQERLHAQAREQERVTAERLRSFNLIAGGVAHDLNNALGPLVALPETILALLDKRADVPREVLEDLDTIRAAGLRAAHTIQDLFLLGRADHVKKRRLDLCRLLRAEVDTWRRLCDQRAIRLVVSSPDHPLVVSASGPHLVRVVSNLVLNAADSIRGAGSILVRARSQVLDADREGMERIARGVYAIIEVEDTGSGIAREHLPHILEPFFTTKRSNERSGTGLGLAIVQRIVKDAGGYIDLDSEVGRGTTFTLYFPLETEHTQPVNPAPVAPVGGSERILVVDDESVQLRTAERILRHLGYSVDTAQSGEEAIAMCAARRHADPFDLLIVDMVMPGGLDGLATIAQIRQRFAAQRVLIASGYAPEHLNEAARQRGLPWLAKPYTLTSLASAVRGTLAGVVEGTALAPSVE